MLRASQGSNGALTVEGLIQRFEAMPLERTDDDGRNKQVYRHYHGLKGSVRIALERLRSSDRYDAAEKQRAQALLLVLSAQRIGK